MGVVDVELWVTLLSPVQLQQSPICSSDWEVILGLVAPSAIPKVYKPMPSLQGPTLTALGQDSNHVKIPVSYLGPAATAMPLIGVLPIQPLQVLTQM